MSKFSKWPRGAMSHSQWAELRRCPKAHHLKYGERLYRVGTKPQPLVIGDCFHRGLELVGLEAAAGRQTPSHVWDDAARLARAECESQTAGLEATRLLAAYAKHYGYENAGYGVDVDVLGVEDVLTGGDLHEAHGGYAAIADAVIEDAFGLWIVETKTAARMPSGTEEELQRAIAMQDQVIGLAYCGAKRWPDRRPGILRNVVTKTNSVGFLRVPVRISDEALENWERDQLDAERLIGLTCANRDACAPVMGFPCQYFEHCHGTSLGLDKDVVEAMYARKEQRK